MGYPTKVQLISRKASEQYYINFPSAVAQAMEFSKGESVEWIIAANVAVHIADERQRVGFVQRAARVDDFPAGLREQIVVSTGRVLERSGGEQDFHGNRIKNRRRRVKKNNPRTFVRGLQFGLKIWHVNLCRVPSAPEHSGVPAPAGSYP